ncbi:MAG: glycosyltransferase family 4 protein, partial [Deltaproteobacteria bacterium]|nr:glycosyltransferase family 4 protein [Deltaproteobacteria bacterium]
GINVDEYQPNYDNQGYAIFLGRLSQEKGVATLLQANRLSDSRLPLKIIGTGPLLGELSREYPEVEFMGYRSGQELKNLVANAAFVVVPSECYENCSMVVLEAMALGKPVIGSRIGGIPEQIEDGRTGFLFEMGNVKELARKIDILDSDAGLRKQLGHAARLKLEQKYSLAEHNRQLLKIYSGLLA